jgi:sodium transport system ATP-binding protein
VARLADELGLHEFLDRRVDQFSTGMKQKTSLARTLVHDPAVLIFDEPTIGLDVMTARNIVRFVRDCRARGKTVIYSTHVMSEVEKICDTIGIIHQGRLVAEGSLAALQERYREQDMEEIFVRAVGGEEEAA